MTTSIAEQDVSSFPLADPEYYQTRGYPHEQWQRLREQSPIARIESFSVPFWAITRHADITTVGKRPDLFLNGPRLMLVDEGGDDFERPPTVIDMDPPEHGKFRRPIAGRFTPRAVKALHDDVDRIALELVDKLTAGDRDGEVEFVEALSAPLPITVIGSLLGVPESDWHLLYEWTNRMVGANDPDFHADGVDGELDGQTAVIELFGYFSELLKEKKKHPDDGLLTLLSQMKVDGRLLEELEALAYCLALVVAGNETTRNATSGGMLALIEHPEQLRRLQADPSLLESGVEEILRWSSPLIHFARTAAVDTELAGVHIEKGDTLALFYPSANRDDAVFENPFEFDVSRSPNSHLAFGVGEHFCLGAHLARLELVAAFKHLLPRIEEVELGGPVERLRSNLVGGVKRLPVRYRLRPA